MRSDRLDAFSSRFAQAYPQASLGVRLRATPLREAFIGRARPFLWLLAGAVGLLLATAGANVANLLVSRAIATSGESAVRLALGAERRHLFRQFLAEGVLVTGLGGCFQSRSASSAGLPRADSWRARSADRSESRRPWRSLRQRFCRWCLRRQPRWRAASPSAASSSGSR
jgi:hypothetical protein